jgi:hypothetical protein
LDTFAGLRCKQELLAAIERRRREQGIVERPEREATRVREVEEGDVKLPEDIFVVAEAIVRKEWVTSCRWRIRRWLRRIGCWWLRGRRRGTESVQSLTLRTLELG